MVEPPLQVASTGSIVMADGGYRAIQDKTSKLQLQLESALGSVLIFGSTHAGFPSRLGMPLAIRLTSCLMMICDTAAQNCSSGMTSGPRENYGRPTSPLDRDRGRRLQAV
jgi:hypothetical protein